MSELDGKQPRPIDAEMLAALRRLIDESSALILEHRHDRGSRSPTRMVFDDGDEFVRYVEKHVKAGDAIWCWAFESCCHDGNPVVAARMPSGSGGWRDGGVY